MPRMPPSPSSSLALDDLLGRMAKGNSTSGWDAVVSYSRATLNRVFHALHASSKLVSKLSFTVDREDLFSGKKYSVDYALTLGTPDLAFHPEQSGTAILTMAIQGARYTIKEENGASRSGEIPDLYSLVVHTPIAVLRGDDKLHAGSVVDFRDQNDTHAHIFLHFRSSHGSGTLFEIEPLPPAEHHDLVVSHLLPQLRQHFQESVSEVQYALAVVHAKNPNPAVGSIVATPLSFVFAVNEDVLSIFVQTRESGRSQGNPHAVFAPGGIETNPLPAGMSASLVLARDYVQRAYIEPSVKKLGRCDFDAKVTDALRFSVFANHGVARKDFSTKGFSFVTYRLSEVVIDYEHAPYVITMHGNAVTVEWGLSYDIRWSRTSAAPRDVGESGVATISVKIPTSTTAITSTDSSLRVSFTPPAEKFEFMVTSEGKAGYWGAVDTKLPLSFVEEIKSFIVANPPPNVVFELGNFDFFEIANLLFPDKTHFRVASSKGASMSCDLIVVGELKE